MGIAAQRILQILIFLADDYGRGRYIPTNIRYRAYLTTPEVLEDITNEMVEEWIGIMEEEGAVEIYEVRGQKYYSLTGWEHYQRGNWRPCKSNIPAPPKKVSGTKRDKSPVKSPPKVEGTRRNEGKGKEENRKEGKGKEINTLSPKDATGAKKPEKPKEKKDPAPSRIITDTFHELYKKRYKGPPSWSNVEGKRVQELLKSFSGDVNRITAALRKGFQASDSFTREATQSFMKLTSAGIISGLDGACSRTRSDPAELPRMKASRDKLIRERDIDLEDFDPRDKVRLDNIVREIARLEKGD